MIQWLRNSKIAMWILTILRVYLGYQWTIDGWIKLQPKADLMHLT